jgi:hypothetical protein
MSGVTVAAIVGSVKDLRTVKSSIFVSRRKVVGAAQRTGGAVERAGAERADEEKMCFGKGREGVRLAVSGRRYLR